MTLLRSCVLAVACGLIAPDAPAQDVPFGPPDVPESCLDDLRAEGAKFRTWTVSARRMKGGPTCVVPRGVRLLGTPSRIRYDKPVRVNCAFARRLLRFERIAQEEAGALFGRRVARIEHLGTYACRRMAEYPDWISEHSFANAIDVAALVLADGRRIEVERHFVRNGSHTESKPALFLRRLARRLYDEGVFSVVLTPNFDRRHANHLHLDGAPYTVDGT